MLGAALASIEPCIFSGVSENCYEIAMRILEAHYGVKGNVIVAHRLAIENGKLIYDCIADFEKLAIKLKCFHAILLYYKTDIEFYFKEMVKKVLEDRLSKKMSTEFILFYVLKNLLIVWKNICLNNEVG